MTQNREAPAYQEYAAAMLSKLEFRVLTLEQRGLLYTMRLECWINHRLPADVNTLARMLAIPAESVAGAIESVMPFFTSIDGYIFCPELDDYRHHLAERRRKQSEGGKRAAAKTNSRNKKPKARALSVVSSTPPSTPPSTSQVPRRVAAESLVQSSTEKHSQNQLTGNGINHSEKVMPEIDDWLAAYESEPDF